MKRHRQDESKEVEQEEFDDINQQLTLISQQMGTSRTKDLNFSRCFITHMTELWQTFQRETMQSQDALHGDEYWPSNIPSQIKVEFLFSLKVLNFKTPPKLIVKYIKTLELLYSNLEGLFLSNLTLILGYKLEHMNPAHLIELNLGFCMLLNPKVNLMGTSFQDMEKTIFIKRLAQLQEQHRENIFLHRQAAAIHTARTNLQPLPLLYPEDHVVKLNEQEENFKPKPHQLLLEFLLNTAAARGLRRTENGVYEEVILQPQSIHTNFFRCIHDDYRKWIYDVIGSRHLNPFPWYAVTYGSSILEHVVRVLQYCNDARFPLLKKRRTLFSFANGIFDAKIGKFYVYYNHPNETQAHVDELSFEESCCQFFPEGRPKLEYFQPHFKIDDILTPTWDKIFLEDQHWSKQELHWWEALLGRLAFDVGELDGWEVAPMLIGVAGCGKSTTIKNYVLGIYEQQDVAIIMDDCEADFTDQHARNAFVVVGLDVSSDMNMSTGRFNAWITGESVTINIKHKEAMTKKWTAPFICALNEYLGIKSKAGSASRRSLYFSCDYAVKNVDPKLSTTMQREFPQYLIKCILRYRKKVSKYGSKGIWDKRDVPSKNHPEKIYILPQRLHDNRKAYLAHSSLPDAFLQSRLVLYGKDFQCSQHLFKEQYQIFCSQPEGRAVIVNNRSKRNNQKAAADDCTPVTFNYALNSRGCHWTKQTIYGLKMTDKTQDTTPNTTVNSTATTNTTPNTSAIPNTNRINTSSTF